MAVRHGVKDTDNHFIIDPVTRTIINESGKLVLIQYDHNSERFTFECSRLIDNHDMSLCNRVEIHYINTGSNNSRSAGVYEIDDLQISADDANTVTCSWLVSQNATQHVGKLNFIIRFACVAEDSTIEYAWNTGIYSDITVAKSIYNGEEFVEDYVDVLEMWKQDLYSEGLKISSIEQTVTSTEDKGVNIITVTMTDGSKKDFEIQNGSSGPEGRIGTSITSINRVSGDGSAGSTDTYSINLSDGASHSFQVYNGSDGSDISSIRRTSGDGSAGSIDTYTITLTDGTSHTFQVYNGKNGADGDGSGDMTAATYDPRGKATDIFQYVDDVIANISTAGSGIWYGTTSTDASTTEKIVTTETRDFELTKGSRIGVKFLTNTKACLSLNVDGTGAIDIRSTNTETGTSSTVLSTLSNNAGQITWFTYDGTYFILDDSIQATESVFGKVYLSDSVSKTSSTTAASSKAVKAAYDKAVEALNAANDNTGITDPESDADTFWATYGATTNAQLEVAYAAGKKIYCLMSNGAVCPLFERYSATIHCFYKGGHYFYCSNDSWTEADCPYESVSNKETSITSESTDETYPSTKAVYDFVKDSIVDVTIDNVLSDTSTNPVQNKVIKTYVDNLVDKTKTTVDASMSDSSTNPVQNKVIKSYVDNAISGVADKTLSNVTKDTAPTSGSTNVVTSGGIYTALSNKAPAYTYGITAKTAGSSALTTGTMYLQYE